jgi:hypothetical protein
MDLLNFLGWNIIIIAAIILVIVLYLIFLIRKRRDSKFLHKEEHP